MVQPKGFAKHKNGKAHPIHEKKGITEDQMKISVKGNNDTIKVDIPRKMTNAPEITPAWWWDNAMSDDARNSILDTIIGDSVKLSEYRKLVTGKWNSLPKDLQDKIERYARKGGGYKDKDSGYTKPYTHTIMGLDVTSNKFAPEIKRAYLNKKEDVDDLLKQRLELLKEKHGNNIVMKSLLLTARPFSNETTFVVTMTNPKTDKDYEQWYINERLNDTTKKPSFEVNRTH